MAVATVHVLHGINTPSNFYSQLTTATPSNNVQTFALTPSGHTQPTFIGTSGVAPSIDFACQEVATALTEFGITGADLSGGNTDFYLKKVSEQGTRVADVTTEHVRLRAAQGFGYLSSINATSAGIATATGQIVCAYDGTNDPLVPSGSSALAGTPAVSQVFTLGPVSLNGSTLSGVDDMTINLNPQIITQTSDGELYPTFVALGTIAPEIVLTTYTATTWGTYGLDGTALTAFVGYLRAKTNDGENVANGTSSHVKFTNSAGGKIIVESVSETGSTPARTTIRIPLRAANASGAALTVATGQAIT